MLTTNGVAGGGRGPEQNRIDRKDKQIERYVKKIFWRRPLAAAGGRWRPLTVGGRRRRARAGVSDQKSANVMKNGQVVENEKVTR